MIAIEPIPIAGPVLASSNVPELTVAAYNSGTTYAAGDLRGVTVGTMQTIYRSLQSGNVGHAPASSPTWWAYAGIVYAVYSAGTSYALGDVVTDTTNHLLYESTVASNVGNPLTDKSKWLLRGATNRHLMFDGYNNTQTQNPESIVLVLNPALIASGFYLGILDADEVTVTVQDAIDGVVYSQTQSLIVPNSGSSFFNWRFKRIARKTWAAAVDLPMYANATITITISKPGGIAKCGMAVIGPVVDVGLSQCGLGTDIVDYSTTKFNADGTSQTVERGFSKRMTLDVVIDNDVIDEVQELLATYRQKQMVWIGSTKFGSACIFGKYKSFKNVIEGPLQSRMALQIDGTI